MLVSIYNSILSFDEGTVKIQLGSIASGLYVLQLTDDTGKQFNLKFVVE